MIVASPPKSPKKGKEEKLVGKGKKTDADLIPEEQKGPPPPHPGSDDWQFVERPIDVVHILHGLLIDILLFLHLFRVKLVSISRATCAVK